MKTPVFPAPKGTPARMGTIQWIDFGEQVQANHNSPTGMRMEDMQTMDIIASGGGLPVSGSGLWELIMRRMRGSHIMVIRMPIPIPRKPRPERPSDQPLISRKTIG